MENMNQNNVNVTTPVEVPEQTTANKKRLDMSLEVAGARVGAGAAVGMGAVYGIGVGLYYAAKWAGKKIEASKKKRAAKKAAKEAEKASEKPSKKKAGEA